MRLTEMQRAVVVSAQSGTSTWVTARDGSADIKTCAALVRAGLLEFVSGGGIACTYRLTDAGRAWRGVAP